MTFTDQMGRELALSQWPPRRIVSLVPSQTEFLYDLGLEEAVVGITKFCIHPEKWFNAKQRVGGTKTIDFHKIAALKPDLIIGNKEENDQSQIEQLAIYFPVWMSDIYTLEDALHMMEDIGKLTGKSTRADAIARQVKTGFDSLPATSSTHHTLYLIWRKPFMAAGSGTFIHDMLQRAGFRNVLSEMSRYPELTVEQIADLQPGQILLSSEPYPFAEKHIAELQEICPNARIRLVDGELFSWYGSRLLHSAAYFRSLRAGE